MPTAIVTHAPVGLGPALTLELASRGWKLVIDDPDTRTLEAQAAGLATSTEVVAIAGDTGDELHREALVAAAGPELDLLVNNAAPPASNVRPTVDGYPLDALEDAYRDTVLAPLALVQAALPVMAPGGTIVNVIPDAGGGVRDVRESAAVALDHLTDAIAAAHPQLSVQGLRLRDEAGVAALAEVVGQAVPA